MNKKLTQEEFDELIYDNEETAVIFFHKEGCNACLEVAEHLEYLSENKNSNFIFAEVDAQKEKELFSRFGLNGVPQVLFFNDGRLIKTLSGKKSSIEYQNAINFLEGSNIFSENENFSKNIKFENNKCCNDICYFCDMI